MNKQNKLFNPFPGLRPYSIPESHLFFGREGQSEEVLYNLSKNKFVAVVGSSGSGKSSLMYCGLVPILYGGFIAEAGSKWKIVVSRPGNDPLGNLAQAITLSNNKETDKELDVTLIHSLLESSSLGLVEAVKQIDRSEGENILILADQFEELFRFKRKFDNVDSYNESYAYVKLLLEAIKQTEVPIYIIMTMRSDFIGECSQYQELTKFINNSHYLIPQMSREDLKAAITGPIAVGGGKISDKLTNQLLNDIGDNPDQLPILQHALMRTWSYWTTHQSGEEEMDIAHYEAIGRMETALSNHANETYDELSPDEKRICENIFKTLTEKGTDNRGIRHPSSIDEIAAISVTSHKNVIKVIEQFRTTGKSFLTSSDVILTPDSIVDISHESLMRIWDKLKIWVEEESLAVQMYIRLSDAAAMYQAGKTGLWRPPDLHLALNWRKEKQPTLTWAKRFSPAFERTMVYLETSEKEYIAEELNKIRLQKKAIRRSRVFAIVLGTAAIISLAFMVYAIMMQNDAKKQKEEAEKQTIKAEVQKEEAEKQKGIALKKEEEARNQRQLALAKEKEALKQKEEAEKQKSFAEQSLAEAKRQREIANQKSIEANEQKQIAENKSEEALIEKNKAEEATKDAYKLRMLSIAQSMAVKSVQINDDIERKSLLAYQAYIFNKKYEGRVTNPDVYDGLYYSLKAKSINDFDVYKGHRSAVRSIAFSHGSKQFYSTGSDGKILRWDLNDTTKSNKVIYDSKGEVLREIAVSNNLRWLACASENKDIILIDMFSTDKIRLKNHSDVVTSVCFTNNSKYLLSAGYDSTIVFWNLETDEKKLIGKCSSPVKSIAISPDNKYVVSATEGGDIILWELEGTKSIVLKTGHSSFNTVTFNPKGDLIAAGDKNGNIFIWKTKTNKQIIRISAHSARINDIAFSKDNNFLASASFDGTTKIWNTENFNLEPIVLKDHKSWVLSLAFTDDCNELVTACVDSDIKEWDIKSKFIASKLKRKMIRNMTENEWKTYVGEDIPYEQTLDINP